LGGLTARVTSPDPSRLEVVAGRDTVTFVPLPANSQVTSDDTFTVMADDRAPIDLSQLQWTLGAQQPPTRRRAVH